MYFRRFRTFLICASTSRDSWHRTSQTAPPVPDRIRQHPGEILLGLLQLRPRRIVPAAHLLQRHVQLEDLFEQLRRNVFGALLADIETFQLSKYCARLIGSFSVRYASFSADDISSARCRSASGFCMKRSGCNSRLNA
jgi:hypothetical protein